MKQNPSQLKFKKYHKVNSSFLKLNEQKNFILPFEYGLKFIESGKLTPQQLEACRKVVKRGAKTGFFKIDIFCQFPVTGKSISSRMGKGKGNFKYWIKTVEKGYMLCGIAGIAEYKGLKILNGLKSKLPVKSVVSKIVY